MKATVPQSRKSRVPSFSANPSAYGMPRSNARGALTRKLGYLIQESPKTLLPTGHNPALVMPLDIIEGLEVEVNSLEHVRRPEIRRVKARGGIYVDRNYQRELSSSDLSFIADIAGNFDWAKYQVPNCYEASDGKLYATDGQKTIIAAAYHDLEIDVLVFFSGPENAIARQAESFLGINTSHRPIKPGDKFPALWFSGNNAASELAQ